MSMRIKCNKCGSHATIRSSEQPSTEVKRLYCICNNIQCGHTFAMDVTFSYTISPSAMDLPEDLRAKIQESTPMEQRALFKGLSPTMQQAG